MMINVVHPSNPKVRGMVSSATAALRSDMLQFKCETHNNPDRLRT